jgi:hypothetical protein
MVHPASFGSCCLITLHLSTECRFSLPVVHSGSIHRVHLVESFWLKGPCSDVLLKLDLIIRIQFRILGSITRQPHFLFETEPLMFMLWSSAWHGVVVHSRRFTRLKTK